MGWHPTDLLLPTDKSVSFVGQISYFSHALSYRLVTASGQICYYAGADGGAVGRTKSNEQGREVLENQFYKPRHLQRQSRGERAKSDRLVTTGKGAAMYVIGQIGYCKQRCDNVRYRTNRLHWLSA